MGGGGHVSVRWGTFPSSDGEVSGGQRRRRARFARRRRCERHLHLRQWQKRSRGAGRVRFSQRRGACRIVFAPRQRRERGRPWRRRKPCDGATWVRLTGQWPGRVRGNIPGRWRRRRDRRRRRSWRESCVAGGILRAITTESNTRGTRSLSRRGRWPEVHGAGIQNVREVNRWSGSSRRDEGERGRPRTQRGTREAPQGLDEWQ